MKLFKTIVLCLCTVLASLSLSQEQRPWLKETRWMRQQWTTSTASYSNVGKAGRLHWGESNQNALNARLRKLRGIKEPKPIEAYERLYLEVIRFRKLKMQAPDSEFTDSLVIASRFGDYNSYPMTRLRFLAQGRSYYGTALEPLGDRLLQKSPNDIDVARTLVRILSVEFPREPSKQLRALDLAKVVYESGGKKLGDMALYGECAYKVWAINKSGQYGMLAKRLLAQYQASPEANTFFIPSFSRYLQDLQRAGF